jgi:hypothetical protein
MEALTFKKNGLDPTADGRQTLRVHGLKKNPEKGILKKTVFAIM